MVQGNHIITPRYDVNALVFATSCVYGVGKLASQDDIFSLRAASESRCCSRNRVSWFSAVSIWFFVYAIVGLLCGFVPCVRFLELSLAVRLAQYCLIVFYFDFQCPIAHPFSWSEKFFFLWQRNGNDDGAVFGYPVQSTIRPTPLLSSKSGFEFLKDLPPSHAPQVFSV